MWGDVLQNNKEFVFHNLRSTRLSDFGLSESLIVPYLLNGSVYAMTTVVQCVDVWCRIQRKRNYCHGQLVLSRGDWGVCTVAPFGPRAIVSTDMRIAENTGDQIGKP